MHTPGSTLSGYILLLTIQLSFLVIFAVYTDYADDLLPKNGTQATEHFIIPKYSRKKTEKTYLYLNLKYPDSIT